MKKFVISSVAILLLAISGGFGYWWWTTTPEYSMNQIRSAAKTRDVIKFEKYVDVESLCTRLVNDVMASAVGEISSTGSGAEALGQALGVGMIEMMKPRVVEVLQDGIRQSIENGDFEDFDLATPESEASDDPEVTLTGLSNQVGASRGSFVGVEYQKKTDAVTLVGLGFHNAEFDEDMIVELKFRDAGRHWQLVEFSNASDLLQRIHDLNEERTRRLNAEIQQKIDSIIALDSIEKWTKTDKWEIDKKSLVSLSVKNLSSSTIDEYHATISIFDSNGDLIKELPIFDSDSIGPNSEGGGSWAVDHNMFIADTVKLYDTPSSLLKFEVKFSSLKMDDGTSLALVKP